MTTAQNALTNACSFLFVPANHLERLLKAVSSSAHAVIADLEDAVAPQDKSEARRQLTEAYATLNSAARARLLVRINAADTPWHDDDLIAMRQLVRQGLAGVVIPKAESAAQIAHVAALLNEGKRSAHPACALVPLISSAQGLGAIEEIAASPGVLRLAFGHLDLQADMGMHCDAEETELLPARLAMVAASRRAQLAPPIDGVTVALQDATRLMADTARSRRFGFGGKLCIHPAQLPCVASVFAPSSADIQWARSVLAAQTKAKGGTFSLGGRMVDAPVVRLAQQTLQRATIASGRS